MVRRGRYLMGRYGRGGDTRKSRSWSSCGRKLQNLRSESDSRVSKKAKISNETEKAAPCEDSDSESEREYKDDMVSQLMATFSSGVNKAVDSDEEDEYSSGDPKDDSEDSDSGSEDSVQDTHIGDLAQSEDGSSDTEGEEESQSNNLSPVAGDENQETDEGSEVSDSTVDSANDLPDNEESDVSNNIFSQHFEQNLTPTVADQIKDVGVWKSSFQQWNELGRLKFEVPVVEVQKTELLLLDDEKDDTLPNIGSLPLSPDVKKFNLMNYNIKERLQKNISSAATDEASSSQDSLTPLQKEVFAILRNYSDFYYPHYTHDKWDRIRYVYCLHLVDHIMRTRAQVLNHSAKIKQATEKKCCENLDVYRDQGYARPKVLILLPMKNAAFRVIETIIRLALPQEKGMTIHKIKRFREEFGPGDKPDKNQFVVRPEDFLALFQGDISEDFRIGIKLTKKSLKLYTSFMSSDIIVASPLGLRYIVGTAQEAVANYDFLSSVEILILDQADVFLMQNWEHVLVLMEAINRTPKNIHELKTDMSRVRMWTLDGYAPLYRQTILLSSTVVDHNRALMNKCINFTGRVQLLNVIENGTVQEVLVHAELITCRVPGMLEPDARFSYFTGQILPQFTTSLRKHTMLFVPDYCDYLRVVHYLKENGGISISTINEYMVSEPRKVAAARYQFYHGKNNFLVCTERFHFYRRYKIKGVQHIIFYDLPTYPHFFSELCNLMVEGNQHPRQRERQMGAHTITVLYQLSDITKLVGILGSKRARDITTAEKSIHMCVIGR